MAESTSSRISETSSAKKAKCLCQANTRTPKRKRKLQDFHASRGCPRSSPETYTTPVVIPRKRSLLKEISPTKSGKKKRKKRASSEPEDRFRVRMAVKIPAWMTETLKTIPSLSSLKRDKELRCQEEIGESDGEGLAVGEPVLEGGLEREPISTINISAESVHTNNTSLGEVCDPLAVEKAGNTENDPSTFSICHDKRILEDVDEGISCPSQSVISVGIEESIQGYEVRGDEQDVLLSEASNGDGGAEVQGETEQRVEYNGRLGNEESSTINHEARTSKGELMSSVVSNSETSVSEDAGNETEDRINNTQSELHEHQNPLIVVISDDESECDLDTEDIHRISGYPAKIGEHPAKRASKAQQEIHSVLTPESLSPLPVRATRHQASSLTPKNRTPAAGGPIQGALNRSRWRNPRKAPSRFSGPQIFTPLTLHPIEPGMGLIDNSYYPQHQGLWKKSTQDLLDSYRGLRKGKGR